MTATTESVKGKLVAQKEGATPGKTVFDLLESQKAQIARALPHAMSADRFARIVATECRRTPRLMGCTPVSFLGAVMLCAQLGLEPGPLGHVYLIPFRNKGVYEVQVIIGWRGYIDLALRSGRIQSIVAREVCENDEFAFEYGTTETITHRPTLTDRGNEIAYYAIAHFAEGGHTFVVLSTDDVAGRRARSRAKDAGPWKTDFTAMARKSAVRALAPFLPLTIEAEQAIAVDEAVPTTFGPGMAEDLALNAPDMSDDETDPVDGAGAETAGEGGDSEPSDAGEPADADPGDASPLPSGPPADDKAVKK